jgi:SAM-dependent methyltransferase
MRSTCRGCNRKNLIQLIDFGLVPLAGGFLAGPDKVTDELLYPLRIHVCGDCALVQILDSVDPEILFQNYSFSSSTIKPLVDHFGAYAKWLVDNFRPAKVVEFGCNDGILIAPLKALGVTAVGVDISANITQMAREKGLDVMEGYFNRDKAAELRDRIGEVDIVTGSNSFAHNDHPEQILEAARHILSETGHLCLEVMYAGDLLDQMQWDTLYHEHLTFYSLSSLSVLLKRYGLHVVSAQRIPMHGGSLRIVAGTNPEESVAGNALQVLEDEKRAGLNRPETWIDFGSRVVRKTSIVKDVFAALHKQRSVWAYGAAGKATMWVTVCGMNYLGGVVDSSPLRAGKLMPGTHTRIVFPDEFRRQNPDCVFVTAWNYADLIRSNESWYRGMWATPLPDLRFF